MTNPNSLLDPQTDIAALAQIDSAEFDDESPEMLERELRESLDHDGEPSYAEDSHLDSYYESLTDLGDA